jgi:hypothetical protein
MLVAADATSSMLSLVLGPIALVVVVIFLWAHQVRTERMKHWRALARQHALKMSGNVTLLETVIAGRIGGVESRIWLGGGQGGGVIAICTHIRCKIPGTMAPGTSVVMTSMAERLQLTKKTGTKLIELKDGELDGLLKCQGITPIKLRQVLTDELVKPLLPKLIKEVRALEISTAAVKVEVTGIMGAKLPLVVEQVTVLAAKLAEAYEAPYNRISAQMGLLYKREGSDKRLLRGVWEELRVLVRLGSDKDRQGRHTTVIRIGMDSGLPAQFRLIPRRPNQVEHGYARILNQELAQHFFASGIQQNLLNALVKSEDIRKALLALHKSAHFVTIEQGDLIVVWFDLLGYELRERILEMGGLVLIIRKQIYDIQFPSIEEKEKKGKKEKK